MVSLDKSLIQLVEQGALAYADALKKANNPAALAPPDRRPMGTPGGTPMRPGGPRGN